MIKMELEAKIWDMQTTDKSGELKLIIAGDRQMDSPKNIYICVERAV